MLEYKSFDLLKTVILAGGRGTRLGEETCQKPKPLIEIGGMPIIWHIMKIYATYGINEFIICCGYKGDMIREYFLQNNLESWKITTVDTGLDTMTGGRLKQIQKYIDDTFCLVYGDDLKNVNIKNLIEFHQKQKSLGTVTISKSPERFGIVSLQGNKVTRLSEKPVEDVWINGGYFVLEPKVFEYIKNDSIVFEQEPLNELIKQNQLSAYKYYDQYQPMDTMKDRIKLEEMWNSGKAYWKTWD